MASPLASVIESKSPDRSSVMVNNSPVLPDIIKIELADPDPITVKVGVVVFVNIVPPMTSKLPDIIALPVYGKVVSGAYDALNAYDAVTAYDAVPIMFETVNVFENGLYKIPGSASKDPSELIASVNVTYLFVFTDPCVISIVLVASDLNT